MIACPCCQAYFFFLGYFVAFITSERTSCARRINCQRVHSSSCDSDAVGNDDCRATVVEQADEGDSDDDKDNGNSVIDEDDAVDNDDDNDNDDDSDDDDNDELVVTATIDSFASAWRLAAPL